MRIADNVLEEINSVEELMAKMGEDPEQFYNRLWMFKDWLEKVFPELTIEEVLKFDSLYQKLKAIYAWNDVHKLLTALEFEIRKK
jgi:hypothetical protein